MLNLTRKTSIPFVLAALLLGTLAGAPAAQKLRPRLSHQSESPQTPQTPQDSRDQEPRNAGSRRERGNVQVDISDDGDTLTQVIVHRNRRHSASNDSTALVRMWEDITIREGQVARGDVVSIGGDITVYGRVKGDVVSVFGDVELKGDAVVEGNAVSVGGTVHREPGAKIGGQNVGMNFAPSGLLTLGRVHRQSHPFLALFIALSLLVFFFFVGWLATTLAEARMRAMSRHLEQHLWPSLLTGLAVIVVFPLACLLLLITIVGIPLALISPLALGLAHLIGFLVVAALVGERLAHSTSSDRHGYLRGMATGLFFFGGIPILGHLFRAVGGPIHYLGVVVTVFGYAAAYVAGMIGLGALILTRMGQRPRPIETRGESVPLPEPTGA